MTRRGPARTPRSTDPAPAPDAVINTATDPPDPRARARDICLRLLTVRARTRAELATALARRGIDQDTADEVLARFSEVGLIDDGAFAESFVHSGHTYRGLGRRALAAQLRRRGVDDHTTGEALAAIEPDAEEEMARTLVRRRLATTPLRPTSTTRRPPNTAAGPTTTGPTTTCPAAAGTASGQDTAAGDTAFDEVADEAVVDRAAEAARIRKLVGMLARRGYAEGLAYRVVRDELRNAGQDTALLDGAVDGSADTGP